MKKNFGLLLALVLTLNVWACTNTSPKNELNVNRSNVVSLTATVEAIDMEKRILTVRGPEGLPLKVHAGKEVINLPQVRVGDKIVLEYLQSLAVRMAKPGEIRGETTGMISAAKPGSKPGILGTTETTVTATIMALDEVNETATLKGSDGGVIVVKVQDPTNFAKVKVGETIVITYIEALALSVKEKTE